MTLATRSISALPPATSVARFAQALALSKGHPSEAQLIAEQWRDSPHVAAAFALHGKAAVAGATTIHATWAGPLAQSGVAQEALEYLRGVSIVGTLEGRMRKIPFAANVPRQTSGGTAGGRVAEGAAVPVVSFAYDLIRLEPSKIESLIVVENTLLRPEIRGAELALRSAILGNLAATIDRVFLDPAVPGSITNGLAPVASTGTTEPQMKVDFGNLLDGITTSGGALVWILRPQTAAQIALTLGAGVDLPRTLFGLPVIVSSNSPQQVTLVDAAEIAYADDGGFDLALSRSGAVQMDSAPTVASAPAPAATSLVSLFQSDSVAFLASRWLNFERLADGAVAYMPTTF